MHDLVIGIAFIAMLMLPSFIAFRSGRLDTHEKNAPLRALTDR